MTEVLIKAILADSVVIVTELLKVRSIRTIVNLTFLQYESVKSIINDPISIFNSQHFCLAFTKSVTMANILLSSGARVDTIQQFKLNSSPRISERISDPLNIYFKQPAFAKTLIGITQIYLIQFF